MGLGGIGGGGSKDAAGLGGFGVVGNGRPLFGPSLSWLQNLPRGRKPKFSPWEDEETAQAKLFYSKVRVLGAALGRG